MVLDLFIPARRPARSWLVVIISGVMYSGLNLMLISLPASAQQYQVWPSLRDTDGPTIDIETEDNVRCRFSHGARPSFSVAGLSSNPNANANNQSTFGGVSNVATGSLLGGGLLLTIPFGGHKVEGCGRLTALQEQRSKLALGTSLLEQGLISQEQYQQLGDSIAKELGLSGSGGMPPTPKLIYESPPPLMTVPARPDVSSGRPTIRGRPSSPSTSLPP